MKKNPWSLNWLNEKKSKLGHIEGVTYRDITERDYIRLSDGSLRQARNPRARILRGKNRKKARQYARAKWEPMTAEQLAE